MKLKKNLKGDYTSEWFYFLVGVVLVVLGLFLLMHMSDKDKENNYQQVAILKDGYQTIQLARTFIQTPLEFDGETKEVAQWANDYFNMQNTVKKNNLKRALYDLAELTIKPHMRADTFDSEATFTYYFLGTEQDKFIVASTYFESSTKLQKKNIVYSDKAQRDIAIQIPFYEKGNQFNPSDKYILFKIKVKDNLKKSNDYVSGGTY